MDDSADSVSPTDIGNWVLGARILSDEILAENYQRSIFSFFKYDFHRTAVKRGDEPTFIAIQITGNFSVFYKELGATVCFKGAEIKTFFGLKVFSPKTQGTKIEFSLRN